MYEFTHAERLAQIGATLASMQGNVSPAPYLYREAYDPAIGLRSAQWYWDTVRDTDTAHVGAWARLGAIVADQYALLISAGFHHVVVDRDPYAGPGELWTDLALSGGIRTLATAAGDPHPVWSDDTNDKFRFVHDMLAHSAHTLPFTREGEDMAYRVHRATMPRDIWPALATETRGQNSALNFAAECGQTPNVFAPQIARVAPRGVWL